MAGDPRGGQTYPGSARDAALDALRRALPGRVTLKAHGTSGWSASAHGTQERFTRIGFQSASVPSAGPGEPGYLAVLRHVVAELGPQLTEVGLAWRGLVTGPVRLEAHLDGALPRVWLVDIEGRRLEVSSPALAAEHAAWRATATQAAAALSTVGQPRAGSWDDSALVSLVRLTLEDSGRLHRDGFTEACARIAAFCDLLFLGRLAREGESWSIDTDPVGFAPVDALLSAVARDPNRPLSEWIRLGPMLQQDVVRRLVTTRRWQQRPRTPRHPGARYDERPSFSRISRAALREAIDGVLDGAALAGLRPTAAALAACAALAAGSRPSGEVLAACGAAAGLLRSADELLVAERQQQRWAAGVSQANQAPGAH